MAEYIAEDVRRVTTLRLREMKKNAQQVAMTTAYDYTMATLVDQAGMDVILVGDSAANVMAGHSTTLPITLDQMIYHAQCVCRAVHRALVVCDMPFGTYQVCRTDALRHAVRIMAESGADALKLEGGAEILDTVQGIIQAGIPVMGHLGLTPQSVNQLGGYGLQARSEAEADRLLRDAHLLEQAGCFALVLEKIPAALTQRVCRELSIPVIGIGAGRADGQVLVLQDLLGMNQGFRPKFLRRYADLSSVITSALGSYITDVKDGSFPSASESY